LPRISKEIWANRGGANPASITGVGGKKTFEKREAYSKRDIKPRFIPPERLSK